MIKKSWLLLLLLCVLKMNAQYTDIVNSNRPGLSESPFSVGLKVLQIESGFRSSFFKDRKINNSLKNRRFDQQFRFGLITENLEFSVSTFQDLNSVNNNSYDNIGYFGYGISLGAKYLIYKHNIEDTYEDKLAKMRSWNRRYEFDWNRLIPSVGISVSGSFDVSPPEYPVLNTYNPYDISTLSSFKIALLLQNDLNNFWAVNTNIIYERTFYKENRIAGIISSNYVVNKRWAVFAEGRGQLKPYFQMEGEVGAAYLFNTNLQIDGSIHSGFTSQGTLLGFSTGFTWRIDNHVDKYLTLERNEKGELVPPVKGPNFFQKSGKGIGKSLGAASKSVGGFFSEFGQNTKHAFNVATIATGNFFRNIFKKKENRTYKELPKRKKKELEKPTKGKKLKKEYLKHHGALFEETDSTQTKKKNFFLRLFQKKQKDSIIDNEIIEEVPIQDSIKTNTDNTEVSDAPEKEDQIELTTDTDTELKEEAQKPKKKKKSFFSRLFNKKKKEATITEDSGEQTPVNTEE